MLTVLPALIVFLSGLAGAASVRIAGLENLAPKAKISAESEYSTGYLAKFVADGVVPVRGGNGDPGKAWCVNGGTHRDGAALVFEVLRNRAEDAPEWPWALLGSVPEKDRPTWLAAW